MRGDFGCALVGGQGCFEFPLRKIGVSKTKARLNQSGRASDSFLQHVLCLLKASLAEIDCSQKIVGFGGVRQLQQVSMQPLLGCLQLSLLNQSRDADELGALRARDPVRTEKCQSDAGARENVPPHADARSVSGNMLALASAQGNPLPEILAHRSKTN